MSRKKSVGEQVASLTTGRAVWLELLTEWILTAQNAGKTLFRIRFKRSGFLPQKGSARTLSSIAQKPVVLASNRDHYSSKLVEGEVVRGRGFEPFANIKNKRENKW